MLHIPGFRVLEEIDRSHRSLVYRAQRETDGRSVVLNLLAKEHPSESEIASIESEYRIIRSLNRAGVEGVIGVYELGRLGHRRYLVMEDVGGVSLEKAMVHRGIPLGETLDMGVQLAGILARVHGEGIVHRDINPSNLVLNPQNGEFRLIDFGLSGFVENQESRLGKGVEGTLAYMAPEQTGRLNLGIDERSDLYSLGATLYRLFTGRKPFEAADAPGYVHCHLARMAADPRDWTPDLPPILAAIVLKLMAKDPDERYQEAGDLERDLALCLEGYRATASVEPFPLAERSQRGDLRFPGPLFAREDLIEKALTQWRLALDGGASLAILEGQPGMGKRDLREALIERFGPLSRVAFGDFSRTEGLGRQGLYGALTQLIRHVASSSVEEADAWRVRIEHRLGEDASLLLGVLPDLRLVLGSERAGPEVGIGESRNRCWSAFGGLFSLFSQGEEPLVLVLENLQLADSGTLKLIRYLLDDPDQNGFMILASITSGKGSSAEVAQELQGTRIAGERLQLTPLSGEETARWLGEVFPQSNPPVEELAPLVREKTGGNPYFMKEFLEKLKDLHILELNPKTSRWQWNMTDLETVRVTSNMVDFLAAKIQELDPDLRYLLEVVSVLQGTFSGALVSRIMDWDAEKVEARLALACYQGLLEVREKVPDATEHGFYGFTHENIRRAVRAGLSEDERLDLHWRAGQALRETGVNNPQEASRLTEHLNRVAGRVADPEERLALASFNHQAAKAARESSAYGQAYRHLQSGVDFVGPEGWKQHPELVADLHVEAAEVAFLRTEFGEAESHASQVLFYRERGEETLRVEMVRILSAVARNDPEKAIALALPVLAELGVSLPEDPSQIRVLAGLTRVMMRLAFRDRLGLAGLPPMKDEDKLAAMSLLSSISSAAYITRPNLFPLIVFKMVELTVNYGIAPLSGFAFSLYALVQCGVLGRFDEGALFGELALKLVEGNEARNQRSRTQFIHGLFIGHHRTHLKETLAVLRGAQVLGLETGDFEFACTSAAAHSYHVFFIGEPLVRSRVLMLESANYIDQFKQETYSNYNRIFLQVTENLLREDGDPTLISGDHYDETSKLPEHFAANDHHIIGNYYLLKIFLSYLFGQFDQAATYLADAEERMDALVSSYAHGLFPFLAALVRLARFKELTGAERRTHWKAIRRDRRNLARHAKAVPVNYRHKLRLVEAEMARVRGNWTEAAAAYSQAIRGAEEGGFIQEAALANERAGEFYLGLGQGTVGKAYLTEALYGYRIWQGRRKVGDLKERYPQYLGVEVTDLTTLDSRTGDSWTSTQMGSEVIDVISVIKALQALFAEINVDSLLRKLLPIMVENAGAEKGYLILKTGDRLEVKVRCLWEKTETLEALPLSVVGEDLCASMVRLAARQKKTLVIYSATKDHEFESDPYWRRYQPKSICCLPLTWHDDLIGILYLENQRVSASYTPDRIKTLELLASQATISIDNAKLYSNLKVSEQSYRELYENALEGFFTASKEGLIYQANHSFHTLLGIEKGATLGESPLSLRVDFFVDDDRKDEFFSSLEERGEVAGFEILAHRVSGGQLWVSLTARWVRDSSGEILRLEGSMADISERKGREEAQREREAARAANAAKSQFLATMSHEIRTPMNAILGMNELLFESSLEPDQRRYVEVAREAGGSLLSLINDVLDLSKVEAGQMELERVGFDLKDLVARTAEVMGTRAEAKNISLRWSCSPEVPQWVEGDPYRLRQVLVNLLGNAIKFTTVGQVDIEVSLVERREESASIQMSVRDTGLGIPREKQAAIFESFTQADASTTRDHGGSGLGLSISRKLVNLMGGDLGVESEVGQGSRFFFTAELGLDPLSSSDRESGSILDSGAFAMAQLVEQTPPMSILLAEDNKNNQLLFAFYLKKSPHTVTIAPNGAEALATFREGSFDLVFMDMAMPVMDGYEATRKIREWESTQALTPVPVVAISAHALKGDENRSIEAGCTAHMTKPFTKDQLLQRIALSASSCAGETNERG